MEYAQQRMGRDPGSPEPALPQPGRLWTVAEANARLAGIRETLPTLRAWVVRLRKLHDELHRLNAFWGREADAPDQPDRELKVRLDDEWKGLTQRLEAEVSRLQGEGIEIKDLDGGLVDFYGLVNGEVVYLCWQRGEDAIGFFHPLDGGYRNRRPLTDAVSTDLPRPRRPV